MAQSVAVVRGTLSATLNGTTDFTKAGLGTAAAALIIVCNANATNNPADTGIISVGFWDGTNQRVCAVHNADNAATTSTGRASNDSYGAIIPGAAADSNYSVSAITDGIRLTLSVDNTTVTCFCTVILWAGVSAKALTFTPNATQNLTADSASLGFAPKAVLFSTIGNTAADAAGTTLHSIISFGFAAQDGGHRCVLSASTSGAADELASLLYSETRAVGQVFNGALAWTGEVTAFNADTFTMTTRDGGSGSDVCFALALGGDVSFDYGTLTTPTSTGAAAIATEVAPDALLLMLSTATGTVLHTDSGANGLMIGLADADGQFSHSTYVEDAAATTNTGSVASATAAINLDTSSGGTRADMIDATVALNVRHFTSTYTAVNATARKGFWVTFGPAQAACVDSTWGTSWCGFWGTSWQRTPTVTPPATTTTPPGMRRARFLRRSHRLPWEQDFSEETEQITVAPPRRQRIKMPPAVVQAVKPIPIETVKEISAPSITIPEIGTANLDLDDDDDDLLWLM